MTSPLPEAVHSIQEDHTADGQQIDYRASPSRTKLEPVHEVADEDGHYLSKSPKADLKFGKASDSSHQKSYPPASAPDKEDSDNDGAD